ncbi:MAG: hypothetical protein JSS14_21810 [Proteobacteria bacterium]|nr:hypothetical protein [Pseudomonadota bacterium]
MTDFIKHRDGWTALGARAARWLDSMPEHSQKHRGDVLTRRSGDFTQSFHSQQVFDGYYSLGKVQGGGTRIVGSPTARGAFTDRGPAPSNGGFIFALMAYYGKGKGRIVDSWNTGSEANFDGLVCPQHFTQSYLTFNGRTLKTFYGVLETIVPVGVRSLAFYMSGGYRKVGGKDTFYSGSTASVLISGQNVQGFITDDGATQSAGATHYAINQLGWWATPVDLGPGKLMKMDRYVRPTYPDTTIDVLACPGLIFQYSTDAGATWTVFTSSLHATELLTLTSLSNSNDRIAGHDSDNELFNGAMIWQNCIAAPLSRTKSVIVSEVPYIHDPGGGAAKVVKTRVKMGVINSSAGCSITESEVLFDGDPAQADLQVNQLLATKIGVLIIMRPGGDSTVPAHIYLTTDGVTRTFRAAMPFPMYLTGGITGFDTKTLVCPMYDGEHTLYESKDFGLSWHKRCTISKVGIAPPTTGVRLNEFGIITYLREKSLPANSSPATPWFRDSHYDDPPPL